MTQGEIRTECADCGQLLAQARTEAEATMSSHSRMLGKLVHHERLIDRDSDLYHEKVTEYETGNIIHEQKHLGMRTDIVLEPAYAAPVQIIEFKRGKHRLLARLGRATVGPSKQFIKAINQLQNYGRRLKDDSATVANIRKRDGIQIQHPELRLVAGRKLPSANDYRWLSIAKTEASAPGMQLQISTWDGFLAELERIVD